MKVLIVLFITVMVVIGYLFWSTTSSTCTGFNKIGNYFNNDPKCCFPLKENCVEIGGTCITNGGFRCGLF